MLDTRAGDNNNSDGFVGSAGSSIWHSLISTRDDAIKAYHDLTIEQVTIEHHRNGAPIQFGWGGENDSANIKITQLTIEGKDPEQRYNMAPFTWESGQQGTRNVTIDGLEVHTAGQYYDEALEQWLSLGLLEAKPTKCTLNLTIRHARLGGLAIGQRQTQGTIVIDGKEIE